MSNKKTHITSTLIGSAVILAASCGLESTDLTGDFKIFKHGLPFVAEGRNVLACNPGCEDDPVIVDVKQIGWSSVEIFVVHGNMRASRVVKGDFRLDCCSRVTVSRIPYEEALQKIAVMDYTMKLE